jgi:hypothetical protein
LSTVATTTLVVTAIIAFRSWKTSVIGAPTKHK